MICTPEQHKSPHTSPLTFPSFVPQLMSCVLHKLKQRGERCDQFKFYTALGQKIGHDELEQGRTIEPLSSPYLYITNVLIMVGRNALYCRKTDRILNSRPWMRAAIR